MKPHDEMLDQIALLALGVLPADEAAAVSAHIAACEECRAHFVSLRAAADLVGYGAELSSTDFHAADSARLRTRVMSAIHDHGDGRSVVLHPAFGTRTVVRSPWLPYVAAAAALLVAVVSSTNYATLRKHADADAQAAARGRAFEAKVARMFTPGSRYYPVSKGTVVISGTSMYLALRDLPAPAPGKVYQAWTLHSGAKTMTPSITFVPNPSGITLVQLPLSAAGLAAVAISVEPSGGSKAPTSAPTFVRSLT